VRFHNSSKVLLITEAQLSCMCTLYLGFSPFGSNCNIIYFTDTLYCILVTSSGYKWSN